MPRDLSATIAEVRSDGRQRNTRCPAHDDQRASLSVGRGDDGRILLHDHAGCALDAVLDAAGLTLADLHARRNGHERTSEIVATMDVPGVARRLNVKESWVYTQAEAGTLPSRKVGRYRRFVPAEIERWLQNQ